MKNTSLRPGKDEIDITVAGPGYGERIVMHIGADAWIAIDSFLGPDEMPNASCHLKSIGVDP